MANTNTMRSGLKIRNVKVVRSYLMHDKVYGDGAKDPARMIVVRLDHGQAVRIIKECKALLATNNIAFENDMHILSIKPARTYVDRTTKELTDVIGPDGKKMYDLTFKIKAAPDAQGRMVSAEDRVKRIGMYNTDNSQVDITQEPGGELVGDTVHINGVIQIYKSPKDGKYGVTSYLNQIMILNRPVRGFRFDEDDEAQGFAAGNGFDNGFEDESFDSEAVPTGEGDVPNLDLPFPIDELE